MKSGYRNASIYVTVSGLIAHALQPERFCVSAAGSAGVSPSGETHADSETETLPLKQRLALYQAAATKEERSPSVVFTSVNTQTRMNICYPTHFILPV